MSVADELLKLRSLVEQGLLTQGEFDQQKARLLSQ
ncbi:SHOCT domain-containing protein [Streptomyces goshikiensis]